MHFLMHLKLTNMTITVSQSNYRGENCCKYTRCQKSGRTQNYTFISGKSIFIQQIFSEKIVSMFMRT